MVRSKLVTAQEDKIPLFSLIIATLLSHRRATFLSIDALESSFSSGFPRAYGGSSRPRFLYKSRGRCSPRLGQCETPSILQHRSKTLEYGKRLFSFRMDEGHVMRCVQCFSVSRYSCRRTSSVCFPAGDYWKKPTPFKGRRYEKVEDSQFTKIS